MTDDMSKAVAYCRLLAEQYTGEARAHILTICDAVSPPSDSLVEAMARAMFEKAWLRNGVTWEDADSQGWQEQWRDSARAALAAQRAFKRAQR